MNNLDGFGNPVAHILLNDRLVPVISRKAADLALMKDTYLQPSCSGGLQSLQKHITREEVRPAHKVESIQCLCSGQLLV